MIAAEIQDPAIVFLFEMALKCKKIPYGSRAEAKAVLKRNTFATGKPYPCWMCGNWHLGTKVPKKSIEGIKRKKRTREINHFNELLDIIDVYCGVDVE